MSNNIIGGGCPLPQPKIVGTQPTPAMMPTTIQALVNRPTLATTLVGYLVNGFDWCKWVNPKVARFPKGYIPSEKFVNNFHTGKDGRLYSLLDGDHRKHMFLMAFPREVHMPVQIIDVRDEAHYHELFYEINFKNRKNANPNEVFLHLVLAGDTRAVAVAKTLVVCGVGVQGSPEAGGTVGSVAGPLVNVSNFRTALKLTKDDTNAVKNACADISKTWTFQPGKDKIAGDLLGGVSLIRNLYPEISNSKKLLAEWNAWLAAQSGYSTTDRAREFKKDGGDIGNKQGESVAYGILKDFLKFGGQCVTKQHKSRLLPKQRVTSLL
jgi:hypothetical protein